MKARRRIPMLQAQKNKKRNRIWMITIAVVLALMYLGKISIITHGH